MYGTHAYTDHAAAVANTTTKKSVGCGTVGLFSINYFCKKKE